MGEEEINRMENKNVYKNVEWVDVHQVKIPKWVNRDQNDTAEGTLL